MERREFEGFGGLRIVADAFGAPDSSPVVLVHSGGQSKEFWHGSAMALAEAGRYALCVDLRGHGESGHASDGRYDLERIARIVDGADVIALQEVERFWKRSGLDDQPAILAGLLPAGARVFWPAGARWGWGWGRLKSDRWGRAVRARSLSRVRARARASVAGR